MKLQVQPWKRPKRKPGDPLQMYGNDISDAYFRAWERKQADKEFASKMVDPLLEAERQTMAHLQAQERPKLAYDMDHEDYVDPFEQIIELLSTPALTQAEIDDGWQI